MTRLTIDISISLDGYVAGPHPSLEDPLGIGGERLHEWAFAARAWHEAHGHEGGEAGADADVIQERLDATGASIMGRQMYSGGAGPWAPPRTCTSPAAPKPPSSTCPPPPPLAPPPRWPHQPLVEAGGAAARGRGLRARHAERRDGQRAGPDDDPGAAARRRPRRARRRRRGHARRRRPGREGAGLVAARRRMDARELLRPARHGSSSGRSHRWDLCAPVAQLGVRVGGARPRAAPGGRAAARGAGARTAAAALRQLARPRRPARLRHDPSPPLPLPRRPLQARRRRGLEPRAVRGPRRHRRGGGRRLQGPVRDGDRGRGRARRRCTGT